MQRKGKGERDRNERRCRGREKGKGGRDRNERRCRGRERKGQTKRRGKKEE